MTDHDIEGRLRATMSDQAYRVSPDQVTQRLSVTSLTAQNSTPTERRFRLAPPLLAAASVAAVVTGAALLATSGNHHSGPLPAGGHGATTTVAVTRETPADSYTYVKVSGADNIETWIPSDRSQQWQLSRPDLPTPSKSERANCAAFSFFQVGFRGAVIDGRPTVIHPSQIPGCDQGSWTTYRPSFFDSLPEQPAAVLASMRSGSSLHTDADTFATGYDALSQGWVQPSAVKKVVTALELLPGVSVSGDTNKTVSYAGHIKTTVLQHWSFTLDPTGGRVIATDESGGDAAAWKDTISYHTVNHLGQQ